ncbi:hypothetical protein [Sediminibacterium ginsengisoli]|uniref:Dolichyl-phosphate-mannose-protein mannosyltransferase n=1 Tax=Sediminibacterium ginsengisoli TaxID=413434 RepID=A0A1T4MAZ5_9BACT|nr:hypothetical protein [Sediminibacterium ginsengisoli]SJZ63938.1 hypothetical protein SAMN04488132_103279 [Sediminibacterium ginsengisoli]
MKQLSYRNLLRYSPAFLAAIIAITALKLLMAHSGIGISPDSVEYLTTAENIRLHGRIADFTGEAMVIFPAGYPALLAGILFLTGKSILQFAPILNEVLLTGILFLTNHILNGFISKSWWLKLAILFAIVCTRGVLQVYSMLWSETLFVFLSLAFIIALRGYLHTHQLRRLIVLALIAAMAVLTRYAGVVLLGAGSILLLADPENGLRKRLWHCLLFNFIAIIPVALNLLHNHKVSGTLTGAREPALSSFPDNMNSIAVTLSEWLPVWNIELTGKLLLSLLLLGAGCVVVYRWLQQQSYSSYQTLTAAFFLAYTSFMLIVATFSRFEELNNRLLLPVYIPMLLMLAGWGYTAATKLSGFRKIALLTICFCLYTSFHIHQYKQNSAAWNGIKDAGIPGYTEDSWAQSETIGYIRNHKPAANEIVFAHATDAIWFLCGIYTYRLPHRDIESELGILLSHPRFTVIMLDEGNDPDLIDIDIIKKHRRLLNLKTFADGAIYYFGQ